MRCGEDVVESVEHVMSCELGVLKRLELGLTYRLSVFYCRPRKGASALALVAPGSSQGVTARQQQQKQTHMPATSVPFPPPALDAAGGGTDRCGVERHGGHEGQCLQVVGLAGGSGSIGSHPNRVDNMHVRALQQPRRGVD